MSASTLNPLLRSPPRALDALFAPQSIAVIGATEREGSVGRAVLENLLQSPFRDFLYPINPKRRSILGIKAFPSLADVEGRVDLAIIATPAASVPEITAECVRAGVKAAIILSAGFKEIGPEGLELESRVLKEAQKGRLRILGPNCLGIIHPLSGLQATFSRTRVHPGRVAFLSQSGALGSAVLDLSLKKKFGFSAFVSMGSMIDIGWGDLIDHFAGDPHTQSIVIYMESVGDAASFLSAAREAALTKPIVVLKAGRTEAAAKAAASHTGALAGSDEVLNAAFQRCGVLRVQTIEELFITAELLAKQPLPADRNLTILTNAGGPGVLATDALIEKGGKLATLSTETLEKLNQFLPPSWSHGNPIDLLGDADPNRYERAAETALGDPASNGLLMILTPQAMTRPTETAQRLTRLFASGGPEKPVLASWMGGDEVADGEAALNAGGVFTFPYPDNAARAFVDMWEHGKNLKALYETPSLSDPEGFVPDRAQATAILSANRQFREVFLNEYESKKLLETYGIPTLTTRIAKSESEAASIALHLGFPVVIKLFSQSVTHKTDVGGVKLNLKSEDEVRQAYREIERTVSERLHPGDFLGVTVQRMVQDRGIELILGSSVDPQFGPILLFGAGGIMVEIFKDRALGLPPLTTTLARRIMEKTRIFQALKEFRGRKAVDLAELEKVFVRLGRLVVEQPWIKEIDINPLLASPSGLIALDARVVLHDRDTPEDRLPRPAIRPYPDQYTGSWTLKDGTAVTLRPIRPEDEPLMAKFHESLSDQSVYARYFRPLRLPERIEHKRLFPLCFIDYRTQMALVAIQRNSEKKEEILGVGRLIQLRGVPEAEFALLIADPYQRRGLGTEILKRLISIAREEKLKRVTGLMLTENHVMQKICEQLGFEVKYSKEQGLVSAHIDL